MANPQKEDGYTPIANEILERLITAKVSGQELQVLFYVIRKTYGYQKKVDKIPLSQFVSNLGIDKRYLCRVLPRLVEMKMLIKSSEGKYGFNKDHDQWVVDYRPVVSRPLDSRPVDARPVVSSPEGSGQQTTKTSGQQTTLNRKKEIHQKKDILPEQSSGAEVTASKPVKKRIEDRYPPEVLEQINALLSKMHDTVNPNLNFGHGGHRENAAWLIQKYGLPKLLPLVEYAASVMTEPFAPTVTTPLQLREKMPQLINYYHKQKGQTAKNTIAII